MHVSHDLSKSSKGQLRGWLRTYGKLPDYLTPPKELDGMTDDARQQLQSIERTDAAEKLVDLHLHETREFTDIVSMLMNPNNDEAVEDCRKAVREVLGEVQAIHWSTYLSTRRNSNRLVAAK